MEDQVMKVSNIDYIGVLDYFENNQEVPYSNPEIEGIALTEKERLLAVEKSGEKAVNEMKKMAAVCDAVYHLDECVPGTWLDSSKTKTKKCLCTQMKYEKYKDDPTSISIFVEKNGDKGTRFRISLDIKSDGENKKTVARFHSYLDMPIIPSTGLVLVSGSNNWGNPEVLNESQESVRAKVETGKIRKVQLCKFIERKPDETNEYFQKKLLASVGMLIPYYEHVLGIEPEEWWPSKEEYDPGISVKQWVALLKDPEITKTENLRMFAIMIAMGGAATCAKMAELYGNDDGRYNTCGRTFGERVHKKTNCPLCPDKDGDSERERRYTIPFVGRHVFEDGKRRYCWKIRDELREALDQIELPEVKEKIKMSEKKEIGLNTILYGPPGTGKTYNAVRVAVSICDPELDVYEMDYSEVLNRYRTLKDEGRIEFITFHQSYGYEEFIEGIKPVMENKEGTDSKEIRYDVIPGLFKIFCKNASMKWIKSDNNLELVEKDEAEKEPYVFIIDEINRGNISKIFGELITLIEVTKRKGSKEAMETVLPYSGEPFSVPKNVYILGTMNTADRSIALMDTALRRRFDFVEMIPDPDILKEIIISDGEENLNVAEMLRSINSRIEYLYDREHRIGHAFFMKLQDDKSITCLADIFRNKVVPLLQEYFYEDYEKIQLVLGDNYKSNPDYKFIKDNPVEEYKLFKNNPQLDLHEKTYEIQNKAFEKLQSYIEITESR